MIWLLNSSSCEFTYSVTLNIQGFFHRSVGETALCQWLYLGAH